MKKLKVYHLLLFIIVIFIIYLDCLWYQSIDFIGNKNQKAEDFIICQIMFGIPILSSIIIITNIGNIILKILNQPLKIKK